MRIEFILRRSLSTNQEAIVVLEQSTRNIFKKTGHPEVECMVSDGRYSLINTECIQG